MKLTLIFSMAAFCATTLLAGPKNIAPEKTSRPFAQVASLTNLWSGPIFLVRYPAYVTDAGARRTVDTLQPFYSMPSDRISQMLEEVLIRSAYYAIEFAAELQSGLPPGSVVLQPQSIDVAAGSGLTQKDGLTPPPALLTVDMWCMPWVNVGYGSSDKHIQPYWTVHRPYSSQRTVLAVTDFGNRWWVGSNFTHTVDLWGDYVARGRKAWVRLPEANDKRPARANSTYRFVDTTWKVPVETITSISAVENNDPLKSPFHALWAKNATIFSEMAGDPVLTNDIDAALASYARGLGLSGEMTQANKFLIQQFLNVEKQFCARQDLVLAQQIYSGDFGKSLRTTRKAEVSKAGEIRSAQRAALFSSLASFGTALGSTVAANEGAISQEQNLSNIRSSLQLSTTAQQDAKSNIASTRQTFERHFSRVQQEQATYIVKTSDGEREVKSAGLDEMRSAFRKLLSP